jgi:hypothetical protein
MKAAGIVILFPLVSVIIVSLYVHGGASKIAALAVLGASIGGVLAAVAGLVLNLGSLVNR